MKQILATAILLSVPALANAATFSLSGAIEMAPSYSYSADGINMTVSDASYKGATMDLYRDADGLVVLDAAPSGDAQAPNSPSGTGQTVDVFSMVFSENVLLNAINISMTGMIGSDETLTFSALSGSVSTGAISGAGSYDLGALFVQAGESVSVTSGFGAVEDYEIIYADSLMATLAPVPLPASLPFALVGLGGLVALRRRANG